MANATTVTIVPNVVNGVFKIPMVDTANGESPLRSETANFSVVIQGYDIGPVVTTLYSDFFVGLSSQARELNFSGTAILVDGIALVETSGVGANSIIMLTYQSSPAEPGSLYVGTKINGVSFEVRSSNIADTGTVGWCIVKQ